MSKEEQRCGLTFCHPTWLQRFANPKMFIIVYGFLGTIQAMSFVYFIVTLTTIEKRFQIPSSTFGIILSGNEISQILLSLILSYLGGYRNRPRWIAWGVFFCALSCIILATPHFIYGAGEDALRLTEEYLGSSENLEKVVNITVDTLFKRTNRLCTDDPGSDECSNEYSLVPLVLIFISQFVLGIGNTLYYSLGQSYLDDNISNKTSTPVMLAWAFSLRMMGPAIGFLVGFGALKVYIDPFKTPTISSKDPRWLGAWWLGWIVLGSAMAIFSILIGLFPKELPKKGKDKKALGEQAPLNKTTEPFIGSIGSIPEVVRPRTGFMKAVKRLLVNKVLMFNIFSGVFYILGSGGYITYIAKYMEVQFHRNSSDATIITGPVTLLGMVFGILASGYFISKVKPRAKYLLFWNVIVGCIYVMGQFSNLFFTCPDGNMPLVAGRLTNLTSDCNANCACDAVPYSPVCHEATGKTYFSPCHAGCGHWNEKTKVYSQCECAVNTIAQLNFMGQNEREPTTRTPNWPSDDWTPPYRKLEYQEDAEPVDVSSLLEKLSDGRDQTDPQEIHTTVATTQTSSRLIRESTIKFQKGTLSEDDYYLYDDYEIKDEEGNVGSESSNSRKRRDIDSKDWGVMLSGACLQGCAFGFYAFTVVSGIINVFGSSGRIGNLLVNYRCVTKEDKSVTQGLALMLISLFALIPGPILYGRIIDSTCLVWTEKCGTKGTCQLYDQKSFRYYINITAMSFTSIGVLFDILVWWFGRSLELYEENEGTPPPSRKRSSAQKW